MGLLCPICRTNGIKTVEAIELPAPDIWQECQVQILDCPSCEFRGPAVYLESRAGRLDSELVKHYAYRVSHEELVELQADIAACPNRRSKRCKCESHQTMVDKYRIGAPGGFKGLGSGMWLDWVRDS